MSLQAVAWAARLRGLTPPRKLVLLMLAERADPDTDECWPSYDTMALDCGLSRRTCITVVEWLEENSFITKTARAAVSGRQTSNSYRVNVGMKWAGEGCRRFTPEGAGDSPPEGAGDSPEPSREEPATGTESDPSDPDLFSADSTEGKKDSGRDKGDRAREAKPGRRKPELPLPEGWVPSDRNLADARSRGFTQQEIDREAAQFRDHHLARDTRFRDWDAAWRTWLGNARRFANGRVVGASFPGGGGRGGSMADIAARRRAQGLV